MLFRIGKFREPILFILSQEYKEGLDMTLAALWNLQNLYLEQDSLTNSLNTLETKDLRREKEEIIANHSKLKKDEEKLKVKKSSLKRQEDLYAKLAEKRKEVEEYLYSGQVSNPKELEGIEGQLQQLEQELNNCEEGFLNQTESIEQELEELQKRKQDIKKEKQQYKEKVANFLNKKQQAKNKLVEINKKIQILEGTIEPNLLALYHERKQALGFKVLSAINEKTCSTCHMLIPALILKEVRLGGGLVNCESCGRILYWE